MATDHDRHLRLQQPRFTLDEVARQASVDPRVARRIFRAIGMAERRADEAFLDEQDVAGLRAFHDLLELGTPMEEMIALSRAYGYAMSRIADAEAGVFRTYFVQPMVEGGLSQTELEERLERVGEMTLRLTDVLLHNTRRVHLAAALREVTAEAARGGAQRLAVAFVDLVDFSVASAELDRAALSAMISTFEDIAISACVDAGAHLVKVLGDGAMAVSAQPPRAFQAAEIMVRVAADEEGFPDARAGLDFGDVVSLGGDYFGTPVNRASRITAATAAGTIAMSAEFKAALGDGVATRELGRRALKGVGEVTLFAVADPA